MHNTPIIGVLCYLRIERAGANSNTNAYVSAAARCIDRQRLQLKYSLAWRNSNRDLHKFCEKPISYNAKSARRRTCEAYVFLINGTELFTHTKSIADFIFKVNLDRAALILRVKN